MNKIKLIVLLFIFTASASQGLATESCTTWYANFMKQKLDENAKIKTQTIDLDKNICGGKQTPFYSQCFKEHIKSWKPDDTLDVVTMSDLLALTTNQDEIDRGLDRTAAKLTI